MEYRVDQRYETGRITPEALKEVRSNINASTDTLQAETELSEYAIEVIKEAKRNQYWKDAETSGPKYERLTEEMEKFILNAGFDTWQELKRKFNRAFEDSRFTPASYHTVKKCYEKLEREGSYA